MLPELISVALLVTKVLEDLDIPYLIGGSLASTAYGMIRTTQDVDIIADIKFSHVQDFFNSLKSVFFLDDQMIVDAIETHSTINIIHRELMFKVDVFVIQDTPFENSELSHAKQLTITTEPERTAFFAIPEDTILSKLRWYRIGGELSEHQWRDVIGILKIRKGNLDIDYLRKWSAQLKVLDLFEKVLQDAI
jgi:hypothetical protein